MKNDIGESVHKNVTLGRYKLKQTILGGAIFGDHNIAPWEFYSD